jgi:hypothetical protein
MLSLLVEINYRTRGGSPGSASVTVHANEYEEAYALARDHVRKERKPAKIDGGHLVGRPLSTDAAEVRSGSLSAGLPRARDKQARQVSIERSVAYATYTLVGPSWPLKSPAPSALFNARHGVLFVRHITLHGALKEALRQQ